MRPIWQISEAEPVNWSQGWCMWLLPFAAAALVDLRVAPSADHEVMIDLNSVVDIGGRWSNVCLWPPYASPQRPMKPLVAVSCPCWFSSQMRAYSPL